MSLAPPPGLFFLERALGHSALNLVSLFCVQKVLSEEEIDDNFKALFSKLAGDVRQGLAGMVRWGTPV